MEICRLCLLYQNAHFNLLECDEQSKNVMEIISKHIGVVDETDLLPKHVCSECWSTTHTFHGFHQRVLQAQAKYLNDSLKQEHDTNCVFILESQTDNLMCEADIPRNEDGGASTDDEMDVDYDIQFESDQLTQHQGYDDESDIDNDEIPQTDIFDEDTSDSLQQTPISKYNKYKKEYTCDICSATISHKHKLLEHLLRHVENVCKICHKRCKNKREKLIHNMREHSNDFTSGLSEKLNEISKTEEKLKRGDGAKIISKECDPFCGICNENIQAFPLDRIKEHYKQQHNTEGYIKCCNKKLTTDADIEQHSLMHLGFDHFMCPSCKKDQKTLSVLKSHIKRHVYRLKSILFKCDQCRNNYSTSEALQLHYKYDHDMDEIENVGTVDKSELAKFFTMKCDLCENFPLTSLTDARSHYKNLHGKTGYLICCNKKYGRVTQIEKHLQQHLNPPQLQCDVCGKHFKKRAKLQAHQYCHARVKKIVCEICKKTYRCKSDLDVHMNVHIKGRKKDFVCDHCNKRYFTKKSLTMHIERVHKKTSSSIAIICEYCGREFASRSSVVSHIQIKHQIDVTLKGSRLLLEHMECSICQASFINKYRLKKHMDSIHMGVPQKCSICDKVSPNAAALKSHMRSVHVESSYQCTLCDKSFKAAVALKDHIATHTGEKLYKCSFCPEAFIWRPNMYSHQKKAHPAEWKNSRSKKET